MNTGPGWLCQPLWPPGWNTILCTAMSRAGVALTFTSQPSGPTRLMLNASPNVARPIKIEVVPDGGVAHTMPAEIAATTAVAMRTPFHRRVIDISTSCRADHDPSGKPSFRFPPVQRRDGRRHVERAQGRGPEERLKVG